MMADQLAWTNTAQYFGLLALLAGGVAIWIFVSEWHRRGSAGIVEHRTQGAAQTNGMVARSCGLQWLLDVTVECSTSADGFNHCAVPGQHGEEHICPCGGMARWEWLDDKVVPLHVVVADCTVPRRKNEAARAARERR